MNRECDGALHGTVLYVGVLCSTNDVTLVIIGLGMEGDARPGDGFCAIPQELQREKKKKSQGCIHPPHNMSW